MREGPREGQRPQTSSAAALIATLLALLALLLLTPLADAELAQHGDLFVTFRGNLFPNALPRHTPASIEVRVSGTVRTLSGNRPPSLRRIVIAMNRDAHLETRGLAVCPESRLVATSTAAALAACRAALVGGGSFAAVTAFPEQSAFPTNGRILAFNSTSNGHRTILAHVYGTDPLPITRLIVFHIRHAPGPLGTVLTGALPASTNRYGYVTRIALSLHRRYTYRGTPHGYLSAACAAPSGFSGAVFPFARASMTFADGRTLASTLTRSCRVRG